MSSAASVASDEWAGVADPFAHLYPKIMRCLFTWKPATQNDEWAFIQKLWDIAPQSFTIFGGIHQNTPTDAMHISICVNVGFGKLAERNINLHVYGFWKNKFVMTHVTKRKNSHNRTIAGDAETIATFSYY
jgi:hypothetical protein